MKTKQTEKTFDAVKMMRDARNKITAETQNMNFEELKKIYRQSIKKQWIKTHWNLILNFSRPL